MEFFIQIRAGEVNLNAVKKHLGLLPDGSYQVKVDRKNKRSNLLNAYYWGCVIEFQQEGFKNIGYVWTKEKIHDFNKSEFAYTEIVNQQTGEIKRMPGSTKEMTNTMMLEFIERIKQFSIEWLNIYIPDPNQQSELILEV